MKDKLAIFDLDGTLYNTDDVNYLSYRKALEEQGYTLNKNEYIQKCNGKNYKAYLPILIDNPSDKLIEEIHERKIILYNDYLDYAKENTLLFNIAECMRTEFYLALVTTASSACCKAILKHFKRENFFDLVLTGRDVKKAKPDPEGFLKAMEYFNTSSAQTVIFEDSEEGIQAGMSAGAQTIKIVKF